jgi:hypothetical protein
MRSFTDTQVGQTSRDSAKTQRRVDKQQAKVDAVNLYSDKLAAGEITNTKEIPAEYQKYFDFNPTIARVTTEFEPLLVNAQTEIDRLQTDYDKRVENLRDWRRNARQGADSDERKSIRLNYAEEYASLKEDFKPSIKYQKEYIKQVNAKLSGLKNNGDLFSVDYIKKYATAYAKYEKESSAAEYDYEQDKAQAAKLNNYIEGINKGTIEMDDIGYNDRQSLLRNQPTVTTPNAPTTNEKYLYDDKGNVTGVESGALQQSTANMEYYSDEMAKLNLVVPDSRQNIDDRRADLTRQSAYPNLLEVSQNKDYSWEALVKAREVETKRQAAKVELEKISTSNIIRAQGNVDSSFIDMPGFSEDKLNPSLLTSGIRDKTGELQEFSSGNYIGEIMPMSIGESLKDPFNMNVPTYFKETQMKDKYIESAKDTIRLERYNKAVVVLNDIKTLYDTGVIDYAEYEKKYNKIVNSSEFKKIQTEVEKLKYTKPYYQYAEDKLAYNEGMGIGSNFGKLVGRGGLVIAKNAPVIGAIAATPFLGPLAWAPLATGYALTGGVKLGKSLIADTPEMAKQYAVSSAIDTGTAGLMLVGGGLGKSSGAKVLKPGTKNLLLGAGLTLTGGISAYEGAKTYKRTGSSSQAAGAAIGTFLSYMGPALFNIAVNKFNAKHLSELQKANAALNKVAGTTESINFNKNKFVTGITTKVAGKYRAVTVMGSKYNVNKDGSIVASKGSGTYTIYKNGKIMFKEPFKSGAINIKIKENLVQPLNDVVFNKMLVTKYKVPLNLVKNGVVLKTDAAGNYFVKLGDGNIIAIQPEDVMFIFTYSKSMINMKNVFNTRGFLSLNTKLENELLSLTSKDVLYGKFGMEGEGVSGISRTKTSDVDLFKHFNDKNPLIFEIDSSFKVPKVNKKAASDAAKNILNTGSSGSGVEIQLLQKNNILLSNDFSSAISDTAASTASKIITNIPTAAPINVAPLAQTLVSPVSQYAFGEILGPTVGASVQANIGPLAINTLAPGNIQQKTKIKYADAASLTLGATLSPLLVFQPLQTRTKMRVTPKVKTLTKTMIKTKMKQKVLEKELEAQLYKQAQLELQARLQKQLFKQKQRIRQRQLLQTQTVTQFSGFISPTISPTIPPTVIDPFAITGGGFGWDRNKNKPSNKKGSKKITPKKKMGQFGMPTLFQTQILGEQRARRQSGFSGFEVIR